MEDDGSSEWELLPDDGFLQIHDDDNGKKIFSRRYASDPNHLFVTNYFVFPSVRSTLNLADPSLEVGTRLSKRVLHLPIHLDESPSVVEVEVEVEPPQPSGHGHDLGGAKPDDETVSQVSFKKLLAARENEFVDMKLDSLKSICNNSRAALPQIDLIQYELEDTRGEKNTDHPKNNGGGGSDGAGLTGWKWRAMCSFGVVAAAATFCFIILGNQRKNKREESKLQFQIFSNDDKVHHKNSISMPVSKTVAHITFNFEC